MARRKLTEPDSSILDAADLPDLTDQQMRFVECLLQGMSGSDAYRAAYDCSRMQPNSIWANASRLRHDAKVAAWLGAARKASLGRGQVTLEGHLQELERLREIALETGNIGAAVQAEQLRGKATGHYIDRHEDVTRHDPLQTLKEIAEMSPDLARQLAAQHDIPWDAETRH